MNSDFFSGHKVTYWDGEKPREQWKYGYSNKELAQRTFSGHFEFDISKEDLMLSIARYVVESNGTTIELDDEGKPKFEFKKFKVKSFVIEFEPNE